MRNHNYSSGRSYAGGGEVTEIWFGKSVGGAFTSDPVLITSALTIPKDGSDSVTPWITIPLAPSSEYLLSIAWTAPPGVKVQTAGGGWISDSAEAAPGRSGDGFTATHYVPFDWWIEAETAATTPTVAGFGDSITAGTGTDQIILTSWLSQFARAAAALPIHWCYPGSGMSLWSKADDRKWLRWQDFPQADTAIHAMGQNDLFWAESEHVMREKFEATLNLVRRHLSANVYVSTITPHAGKTERQNEIRRAYADYLGTLPLGVRGIFDFASAVSSDDTALEPRYRGGPAQTDELHPNTSGAEAMAKTVSRVLLGEAKADTAQGSC